MKLSIKTRVNLWFTTIMIIIVGLILGFMLLISDYVVDRSSRDELESMINSNVNHISFENDTLSISDDFMYYSNGINTIIYSKDFNMVAGQKPTGYDRSLVPFKNGQVRKVEINGKYHHVYDTYVYFGKNNGVWLRGILEIRETASVINTITNIALIALPLLVLLASVGGYIITLRAFRPVNRIIDAANEIKDGSDLSARIKLEAAKDELYYLSETFDKMFERLEVSFAAEKEFASNASHELRTPLSVIAAECKYLEGSDDIDEYRESVGVISRQTEKMTVLVNKLLQITRIEQGTHSFSPERINLSEWAGSVCELYEDNPMDVKITKKLRDDVYIDADTSLFGRCMENLIENGIKYNKPGGELTVCVDEDEKNAYIRFADTGIGIDEKNIENIFNRFFREDGSRSDDSLGLGLFLTKQIVNLHGGEISVKSVKGEGSEFEIKIPKKYK